MTAVVNGVVEDDSTVVVELFVVAEDGANVVVT